MTSEQRSFPVDLEIRGDGRTLVGIAAPFDSPAEIYDRWHGGYVETIKRGAFERTVRERGPSRIKLNAQHDESAFPIGRASLLREDARGLYGEFRVSNTPHGDEALTLVKDGTLDGLSIGFRVVRDQWVVGRTERTLLEVALHEVSVVTHPTYDAARITAARAAHEPLLTAARARLDLLSKAQSPWM